MRWESLGFTAWDFQVGEASLQPKALHQPVLDFGDLLQSEQPQAQVTFHYINFDTHPEFTKYLDTRMALNGFRVGSGFVDGVNLAPNYKCIWL